MKQEIETAARMIEIFCRDHHGRKEGLCRQCCELLDEVKKRLEKCPFKEDKPQCFQCAIHCYPPTLREGIRAVMKYAGPRMIFRHPMLTMRHYLNKKTREYG
jgi:hypothetical protein